MRVEVGVKESSKKKLVRSILVGHVEKMGENGGEMGAKNTEIAMGLHKK